MPVYLEGVTQVRPLLQQAGSWYLRSGIQESSGGVARYYRVDEERNLPFSTEITGYAASFFLFLYEQTGSPEYRTAALAAGAYLTQQGWRHDWNTFPFEVGGNTHFSYFFDCGIIVRGLLALWRATQQEQWLAIAQRAALAMRADFVRGGVIHPILELPDKNPVPHTLRWSQAPGCYQLKSALAWYELWEIIGDGSLLEAYELALGSALAGHGKFLPDPAGDEKTMDRLHAYCYFLEGLTPVAERSECRAALSDAISKAGRLLRAIRPRFERSDVNAQLLRARLLAFYRAGIPLDEASAMEEAAAIPRFQWSNSDPATAGAFSFGEKAGVRLPFANPVSTAFCIQALTLWQEHRSGRRLEFRAASLI